MPAKIKKPHRSDPHRHKPKKVSKQAFEKVYWPYLPLVLLISFLLAFSLPSGALQSAIAHAKHGKVLAYATSMSINGLLTDTNTARSDNGVRSLDLNSRLIAAAQAKADDMAKRNYWSHYTPDGNPPWVFVTNQGYAYQKLGENLAAGFNDEQATIDGWMASPPHRENLLDPAFTDVGFGFANNPNYTSAGGGAMTVVVAFYGEPAAVAKASMPAARTAPPTTPTTPASTAPKPVATKTKPAAKPVAKTAPKPPPSKPSAPQPVNTITTAASPRGVSLSYHTTGAQLALARAPVSGLATGTMLFIAIAAIGLWVSRHLLRFRRVLVYGESYVMHHPVFDVGLLVLGALAYLLTQTVGIIQ